jgi:hypothetical protein
MAPRPRQRETRRRAQHREQDAFGKQLAHQALPVGADREANRDLAGTSAAARQQQVRDINASDQQEKLTAPKSTSADLRMTGSSRASLSMRAVAHQAFEFRIG